MKTVRIGIVLGVTLLLLSACSPGFISRTVPTLGVGETYTQDLTPLELSLAPGTSRTLTYDFDSGLANGLFVVIEAGDLYVLRPSMGAFATSSTGFFFGAGESGLLPADGASPSDLLQQDIGVATTCVGPCVIMDADQAAAIGTGYVRITNPFSTQLTTKLWVFSQDLDHQSEPSNDQRSGAETVTTSTRGALETLGDMDFFEIVGGGDVTIYAPVIKSDGVSQDFLSIRAVALYPDGTAIPEALLGTSNPVVIQPNDSHAFFLEAGEFVEIRAADERAASSQYSAYDIEVQ